MKLSDLIADHPQVIESVSADLRDREATELASSMTWHDENSWTAYVATSHGVYVGVSDFHPNTNRARFESDLTPWADVSGVTRVYAGYSGEYSTLMVSMAVPDVTLSSHRPESAPWRALEEFADTCAKYGRGWQKAVDGSEAH